MALTVISGASSLARPLVMDSKPPLAAEYIEKFATPLLKLVSVIFIIEPLDSFNLSLRPLIKKEALLN